MDSRPRRRCPASSSQKASVTGLLLAAIVGSGIMGERLAAGNVVLSPRSGSKERNHV
jgi:hypothetical protein